MQKHKILSFLLALLVSVGLWVYAVTVVNPDDTKTISNVKVTFTGTTELASKNLILTGGEGQTITVEVSGRRSDLKELNSTSLEAVADLGNIEAAGDFEVSWILDPPSSVASGDIGVVSTNANKVKVTVSEYMERHEIPVTVEYEGSLAEGYVRDPAVLSVETLTVGGPAEDVSRIARAVVTVDLQDATESINQDYAYLLVDEDGNELILSEYVTVSAPEVRVSVPVLCYKEITLKINVIPGGGATERDTRITIDPPIIGVTGPADTLEKLDELVIQEVDLAQVAESSSWSVTPELPAGVSNRATESSVKVTLEFVGLMTKKFTIPCSDIERINDVAGLGFGEQSVVISIRGKITAISNLKLEDIRLVADMTNDYDPTTKTVILTVILPDDSTVGVVGGPYTVQIIETS